MLRLLYVAVQRLRGLVGAIGQLVVGGVITVAVFFIGLALHLPQPAALAAALYPAFFALWPLHPLVRLLLGGASGTLILIAIDPLRFCGPCGGAWGGPIAVGIVLALGALVYLLFWLDRPKL